MSSTMSTDRVNPSLKNFKGRADSVHTSAGAISFSVASYSPSKALANAAGNKGQRWLTFVATGELSTRAVKQLGFDPRRVRLVKADSDNQARWIMWEALRSGTSDLVATDMNGFSNSDLNKLEIASRYGDSQLLLLDPCETAVH